MLRRRQSIGEDDMTIEDRFNEQEICIFRYRRLEREVTDPLALCLLHGIIEELEADLQQSREHQAHLTITNTAP